MDREPARLWDWLAAGILFAAMLVSAGRLLATNWVPHLDYVYMLVTLGVILGLALGKSLFSRQVVFWLAIGYSLFLLPWQLSQATEDAVGWGERLTSLGGRLIYSLAQLSSRQPVDDFILFLTFVSILFLIISIISGYALTRHSNVLVAILLGGLAIVIVHTYDWAVPERVWYLGTFLFLALLLFGRLNFINSSRDWKQRRVFISPEANVDISMAVFFSAAVLVMLAWTMPLSLSSSPIANRVWTSLSRPWDDLKQRFKDAFAAIQGTTAVGPRDFFTDNLALGLGNPLGDAVLFSVQIPTSAQDLPRLYWRGRVYDEFADGNWSTSAKTIDEFDPNANSLAPAGQGKGPQGTFYITTYIPHQSLLYLLPDLLWISRAGEYKSFSTPDDQVDMVLMRASRNMRAGETFSARSRISNPSILQLRQAGEDYPEWVTDRYLQLPADLSPRVAELAAEITVGAETPYDKAAAITNYLRREIDYVERIQQAPPPDTDLIAWFLLDSKQGFCNYYATAEVLMLRSVGVPARLAVGYAQGQPNTAGTTYTVIQKDAHAWVEVYFPDAGWVEFEPTANQSPIIRPEGVAQDDSSGTDLTPSDTGEADGGESTAGREAEDDPDAIARQMDFIRIIPWVIIILLAATAMIFYWFKFGRTPAHQAPVAILAFFERRHLPVPPFLLNWARWAEQTPITRAFASINRSLRWLGNPQPAATTPAERAEKLRELMPEAGEEIDTLVAEHQTALYSPRDGNLPAAQQASRQIFHKTIKRLINRYLS